MDSDIDRSQVFGETSQAVERIAPGFFPRSVEAEHLARYRWASAWVRGRSVLDVACGTGYGSALLLQAGAAQVVAVDASAPALAFAATRYPGPKYVRSDAIRLPLRRDAFDMVVALETIEHLTDPLGFLLGLRASLRKGGLLAVSTPDRTQTSGSNPYHVHEMTRAELVEALGNAGFDVAAFWGQHWRPPSGSRLWRVKGMGKLGYMLERRPELWNAPARIGFKPLYWCALARTRDRERDYPTGVEA